MIANRFIYNNFYLTNVLRLDGHIIFDVKSMQKTSKDFPSFGFLPCPEPQAKARESDARFGSPVITAQILKYATVRDEHGYTTAHR